MDWIARIDVSNFLIFTLVLTRVSGLMMTAPIYGTTEIPLQIRALLAFAVAVLITPSQWGIPLADPGSMLNYLVILAGELAIGLCLGLGITVLFSGIQLAGQMMGRIGGLMLADVFDPAMGTSVPLFSRMLFLVTMAVFVLIGGHRMVMAGLLDTFDTIPLGNRLVPIVVDESFLSTLCETFVVLVSQSFALGIRAAAPVVTALLLSTLVMGLISRTLPQLNIMAVGFGMNSMLSFGLLSLSIGAAAWAFQDAVEPAVREILEAVEVESRPDLLL